MGRVTYKLFRANFRREVLQAEFMLAEMEYRAGKVKDTAEAIAPVDTGRYSRSFRVRGIRNGGIHRDRAAGVVYNTDPAAVIIEYGSTRQNGTRVPGHYTLTTAMSAAGGHG